MVDGTNEKSSWQFTNDELKKALEAWSDLSTKPQPPPADETTTSEVQELLKQLQNKLEELSKP